MLGSAPKAINSRTVSTKPFPVAAWSGVRRVSEAASLTYSSNRPAFRRCLESAIRGLCLPWQANLKKAEQPQSQLLQWMSAPERASRSTASSDCAQKSGVSPMQSGALTLVPFARHRAILSCRSMATISWSSVCSGNANSSTMPSPGPCVREATGLANVPPPPPPAKALVAAGGVGATAAGITVGASGSWSRGGASSSASSLLHESMLFIRYILSGTRMLPCASANMAFISGLAVASMAAKSPIAPARSSTRAGAAARALARRARARTGSVPGGLA
mmetsp:Transcript_36388/g.104617  ORF Transcript_36388/g.104617 Transcript_36388/m.104617 type:complete len:276 (+) Transcript_36388:182-1009(+)